MTKIYSLFALLIIATCALWFSACQKSSSGETAKASVTDAAGNTITINDSSRIVSVGTAVTETIYALGVGDKVVGVDNSSSEYITEARQLPKVGPRNTLSAEGILSLNPTLLVMTDDAGPAPVIDQLKSSGVTVLAITANYSVDAVKQKIRTIAKALNLEPRGEELTGAIDRDMQEVARMLANVQMKPKVVFAGRGPNAPSATMSGKGTTIDEMIRLAGGVNPITEFQGFRQMTDEAVVAAQPDILLMTERSFERSGGVEGVLKFPGVALTPAGKNRRIVPVSDMYFQGFGPGVGRAVLDLTGKLHAQAPEVKTATANENGNKSQAADGGKK